MITSALLIAAIEAAVTDLPTSAWLMLAFGSVFLYGGLIFGIVRAVRGRPNVPDHVRHRAFDAAWFVALATLPVIWWLAATVGVQADPETGEAGEPIHVLYWIIAYLCICIPLSIVCRHLVILHHRLKEKRAGEAGEQ